MDYLPKSDASNHPVSQSVLRRHSALFGVNRAWPCGRQSHRLRLSHTCQASANLGKCKRKCSCSFNSSVDHQFVLLFLFILHLYSSSKCYIVTDQKKKRKTFLRRFSLQIPNSCCAHCTLNVASPKVRRPQRCKHRHWSKNSNFHNTARNHHLQNSVVLESIFRQTDQTSPSFTLSWWRNQSGPGKTIFLFDFLHYFKL